MSVQRSALTSCSMRAMGRGGASAPGRVGGWVAGWGGGGRGVGRSAWILYHRRGRSFSSSWYLYWAILSSFCLPCIRVVRPAGLGPCPTDQPDRKSKTPRLSGEGSLAVPPQV